MTEQDSARVGSVVIMTSINERFVSVILCFCICVSACLNVKIANH